MAWIALIVIAAFLVITIRGHRARSPEEKSALKGEMYATPAAATGPRTFNVRPVHIAVGTVVIAALAAMSNSSDPATTSATVERSEPNDFHYQYQAEKAVRERLRDPESGKFRNVVVLRKKGVVAVCGEVNAKNAFGGFTGFDRFVVTGTVVSVRTDGNADSFRVIWNAACS